MEIEPMLSSLEVAEMVEKQHKDLMRDIRRYMNQFNESNIAPVEFFRKTTYKDSKGEERTSYLVTKKGCEFIAHKLTGVKGTKFTATYINRFHEMEGALESQVTPAVFQQFMEHQQRFMEYQQSFMEELAKNNRAISDRLDALEARKETPAGITVGPGPKPSTVLEDERSVRKKKLNRLVTQMAKAFGWSRSFTLHRLYKTLEEVLDVSMDTCVELYKEEIQEDACAIDAVVAYEKLYTAAIRLCNNTLSKLSVEVQP